MTSSPSSAASASNLPAPKLTLVPNDSVPAPFEAESEGRAVKRLLAAVAAEQVREGEGGFTP
jgi:hypothetical protein